MKPIFEACTANCFSKTLVLCGSSTLGESIRTKSHTAEPDSSIGSE